MAATPPELTRLGDLTWMDARTCGERAMLLVPVGATEQHGPHLPLSTDTDIAVAVAARAARMLGSALVAPALAYGSSGEHSSFEGTLSIGQEAMQSLIIELVRSASETFARTVLVSTHGGNWEPVRRACDLLRSEGRGVLLWRPPWKGDAHAGRTETSVMLAIDSARVALDLAAAGNAAPIELLMPELRARGLKPVSPNGVLGDPGGASAEEGERLLDAAVEDLVRTIVDWTEGRR